MELLAPAGGYEQALASIDAGCNALYGGLKKWSARSRAQNLSDEEYRKLIEICQKKGISFYLTLNTLMSDKEISDIVRFFKNPNNPHPDGVLVGDIGLIDVLSREFPAIPLHASTQFGAYSLRDVLFLKKIGIYRIVLARELTLKEIQMLRENTDVELEVFVYGNQCTIFSGNCLWGGLSHSGSGHRGCCIGSCNDIFQRNDGTLGNYLWSNKIGIFALINDLKKIGIESIKIEGRVRAISEIEDVVSRFRLAIDGEKFDNDYFYEGYLGGKVPPIGIFHKFNPENHYQIINNMIFTEYDYLMNVRQGECYFERGNTSESNKYVFTAFHNGWIRNNNNIIIRYTLSDGSDKKTVKAIQYFRVDGTRASIELSSLTTARRYEELSVIKLYNVLKDKVAVNIYEFKSKLPANAIIRIDLEALEKAVEYINEDVIKLSRKREIVIDNVLIESHFSNKSFIMTDSVDELINRYSQGYRKYIYVIKKIEDLKYCIELISKYEDADVYYRLPYLDFNNRLDECCELLYGQKVMITRTSQLLLKNQYKFSEMIGDYSLNIWNVFSARWYRQQGVRAVIAHPEIAINHIEYLEKESGLEMIVIAAARIPFGYTRACFKTNGLCEKKCDKNVIEFHNTYKDTDVDILCDNDFGFRTITDCEYYVATQISDTRSHVFGLMGISKQIQDQILQYNTDVFEGKEIIY